VLAIAVDAPQSTLAVGQENGVVLVNLQSGKVGKVLKSARPPFAFEGGGTLLTAIADKRGLQRWTLDGRPRAAIPQVGQVRAVSADGSVVAGAKGDWEVRLWHARRGGFQLGRTIKNGGMWGGISKVRLSRDGRQVALLGGTISKPPDGFAQTYDVATGQELHYCTAGFNIYNAAISPDLSQVVASGEWEGFGILTVCGTSGWSNDPSSDEGASLGINTVVLFSPDSKTLLTAGSSAPVRLWDAHTGKMKRTLP
jgi:WD40 repeat protein